MHTTESDGKNSPREMVEAYLKAGFGAVAITDHDTITDSSIVLRQLSTELYMHTISGVKPQSYSQMMHTASAW